MMDIGARRADGRGYIPEAESVMAAQDIEFGRDFLDPAARRLRLVNGRA
jgi:hypothetical protein